MKIALVIFVALLWCACGPQMECDDMGRCATPFERIVVVTWNESAATAALTVPNLNGCSFIAMGSQDSTGGVLIVPTINNQSGLLAYMVTPEAPFIGRIEGPFTVHPLYIGLTPVALATAPVLDLLVFEDMPPWFNTKRAPFAYGNIKTLTAGADSLTFNVRGRKQVEWLIVEPTYASTETFTVSAEVFGTTTPGAAGSTAIGSTFDTRTYATPAAAVRGSFNNIGGLLSTTPGSPAFDRLVIGWAGTGAATAKIYVQAWD